MSEMLTASGASNSALNEDSARLESLTAENINFFPFFTLSDNSLPSFQKISLSTIVVFSSFRLIAIFFLNQPLFKFSQIVY